MQAPFLTRPERVLPEWIDYNGHMNVAYYTLAFDRALDQLFDGPLDLGAAYVRRCNMGPMALQTHIHYLGELREGAEYRVAVQAVDADAKRLHLFAQMLSEERIAATYEVLTMNVDLTTRRAAPYPAPEAARVQALLAAHAGLPRPAQLGAPLGIRRA